MASMVEFQGKRQKAKGTADQKVHKGLSHIFQKYLYYPKTFGQIC